MMSSGRRKLENSPISIVARSQKLQTRSIVSSTAPATCERGNCGRKLRAGQKDRERG